MRHQVFIAIFFIFTFSAIAVETKSDRSFEEINSSKEVNKGIIDQVREMIRDPFSTSMKLINDNKNKNDTMIPDVKENADIKGAPQFILKGLMISASDSIVLIEVNNRSYVLRQDDTLSLQQGQGRLVLQVHKISRYSVQIKIGESGSIIIIK